MPLDVQGLDTRRGPAVSILLAVYNGARYLPQTIDAVVAQTMGDWELVVINDGSTDSSSSLIRAYQDPRIRFLEQPNSGAAAAIDRGLNAATGRYIALLDQDDVWDKEFLRKHIEA